MSDESLPNDHYASQYEEDTQVCSDCLKHAKQKVIGNAMDLA